MKHLNIVKTFASILLLVICAVVGNAQEVAKTNAGKDAGAPQAGVPALRAAPALKTEDLLKIRDVQYRHAQRAAQMRAIEQAYTKLQGEQDADVQKVDVIIAAAAKDAKVDLTKWVFDIEELKFVPREKPAPAAQPSPKQ